MSLVIVPLNSSDVQLYQMNKEILRLAVPNILSNVSVPLLSTVDTALMGHLSADHLGAVGIGAMIFNFVYWNFGFLRMGTTGMTAQAYGQSDQELITSILRKSLLVAATIALLLMVFQRPLEWLSITLLQVDPDHIALVSEYFSIRIWAAPATLMLYVIFGWFFGMQNAVFPLVLTIVINLVNIILSYLFIKQYDMGIDGVAMGTVIAQYLGIILGVILMAYKYQNLRDLWTMKFREESGAIKRFFKVNADLFIRTFFLTFVFAFFYSQSSAAGATILAVNVVLLQLVNWMSYGIDGFAYAAESMVGKYRGMNSKEGVNRSIKYAMIWGLGLAVLFSVLYGFFGVQIFRIFTDEAEVIDAGQVFLPYMILFPLAGFICYIWDGIYIGLTATRTMLWTMLASFAVFMMLHYGLKGPYGNHGLWVALLLFLFIRGVFQSLWYRRVGWDIT